MGDTWSFKAKFSGKPRHLEGTKSLGYCSEKAQFPAFKRDPSIVSRRLPILSAGSHEVLGTRMAPLLIPAR